MWKEVVKRICNVKKYEDKNCDGKIDNFEKEYNIIFLICCSFAHFYK